MITPWQIQFLGGLRISREGQPPVCRLRTTKTTALLAFLCAHIERDQGRDELVDRFWPDLPFDAGRNSLRIALSALRRVLHAPDMDVSPDALLCTTRTHVRLRTGAVETDVALLEEALRCGDRARAATLAAQGPFLPGIYEEWVIAERERIEALRTLALDGTTNTRDESPEEPTALSRVVPGSVPLPLGRFFGRDAETAHLLFLLADPTVRLITITGPGGTGKTRLAVETARALREGKAVLPPGSIGGGVWFVPLVSATQSGHVLPEICRAVGAPLTGNSDPLETLVAHIQTVGGGRWVLVLDNLEQIEPEGCATILLRLLERIPEIVCLTTSRRRIGLAGERTLALTPFPLPASEDSLATLAVHPAVALFVDRAREADVDFVLTPRRAPQIVELCTRLNGVPLALEMAASWAGIYTPGEMAAMVTDGDGDTLPGRHAGRESRHRSLRAVATWSIGLLPPEAQSLLAALSVFQGRWIQEAAAQVAPAVFSPERLALLCDHSLITGETEESSKGASAAARRYFHILPALRPFARELLSVTADAGAAARRDHARYFTEAAGAGETTRETLADTLAALAFWESEPQSLNDALRLVGLLWPCWWHFGQWEEAQGITNRVMARVTGDTEQEVSPNDLSQALRCAGKLAYYRGDLDTARHFMTRRLALEIHRDQHAEVLHLRANLATLDMDAGRYEKARAVFEAVLPLLPTIGPGWEDATGYIFSNYADALVALGLTDTARDATEAHLHSMELRGRQRNGIAGLHWARLAAIHRERGAGDEARVCAEKSLDIFRECGEILRITDGLLLLAGIARDTGDSASALVSLRESFALRRRIPSEEGLRRSVEEAERLLAQFPPAPEPSDPRPVISVQEAFVRVQIRLEELSARLT